MFCCFVKIRAASAQDDKTDPPPKGDTLLSALLYVLSAVASLLLSILLFLMLLRAVFSWFPTDEESAFAHFLFIATEPFILPVRALLDRFEFFRSMPIDMSFFITALLLSILRSIL